MPHSFHANPTEYRPRELPVFDLPPLSPKASRAARPITPVPCDTDDYVDYGPAAGAEPAASQPEQSLTGEIPLLDDYDGENGYTSAYPPDGSGIVREFIPSAHDRREASARPEPNQAAQERRARLERRLSRVVIAILALGLLVGIILMLALPRSTKSMIEKRELARFPSFSLESYFSGEFTAGVANYFTDTVPNRDGLKKLGSNFKAIFGLPGSANDVEFVGNIQKLEKKDPAPTPIPPEASSAASAVSTPSPAKDPEETGSRIALALEGAAGRNMNLPSPATPAPTQEPLPNAEEAGMVGDSQIMLIKQNGHYRGLEPFGGSAGMAEGYVSALNNLRAQLDGSVSIWSMPAPLACQFYTPDQLKEYVNDQSACFDQVHGKLNEGITGINICGVLGQHAGEPIYCRTDHHWQPLGAYYAAQAFAEAAGVPFDDLSAYTPGVFTGFVGSMYGFSNQSAKILNDPEDFTYYTPSAPYEAVYYDAAFNFAWDDDDLFSQGVDGSSEAYLYYLGGDQYIVKADTQVENGRTLLVVKDSFGNAEVPFLVGSFQKIYVADMRYLERNLVSFIEDLGVTDVLFTMSAFSLVGENGAGIADLITQNAGETVTDPHP